MLDWLFRFFDHKGPSPQVPHPPRVPLGWEVTADDRSIHIAEPSGARHTVPWASVAQVTIRTEHSAEHGFDLAWVLILRDGRASLVVPIDAVGEHDFVRIMQSRLAGFDNMAVVEAMSADTDEDFVVWPTSGSWADRG